MTPSDELVRNPAGRAAELEDLGAPWNDRRDQLGLGVAGKPKGHLDGAAVASDRHQKTRLR
jgi:hypothetical protein